MTRTFAMIAVGCLLVVPVAACGDGEELGSAEQEIAQPCGLLTPCPPPIPPEPEDGPISGCGNGAVEGTEQCDGANLGGATCVSLGFAGGTLACGPRCRFRTTGCVAVCGNGKIEKSEECDGVALGGKSCEALGFAGGMLTCGSCKLDTSSCYRCGDGVKNGGEACDGSNLGGASCAGLGFAGGTLSCTSGCTLSVSGCRSAGFQTLTAGTFAMGCPTTPLAPLQGYLCYGNDAQHQVTLTRGFEISQTEVTAFQFGQLLGYDPTWYPFPGGNNNRPVGNVSWNEAAAYANKASEAKGLALCYSCTGSGASVACSEAPTFSGGKIYDCPGYRLPTEAEWEFGYRAGSTDAYYSRSSHDAIKQNPRLAGGWYSGNSSPMTHYVCHDDCRLVDGRWDCAFTGNDWGLCDMAGNASEWTHDRYQPITSTASVTNPWGSATGDPRVVRGGGVTSLLQHLQASARGCGWHPGSTRHDLGFRLVRSLVATGP